MSVEIEHISKLLNSTFCTARKKGETEMMMVVVQTYIDLAIMQGKLQPPSQSEESEKPKIGFAPTISETEEPNDDD